MGKSPRSSPDTLAAHLGRDSNLSQGFVNLPVYHGSTVLFDTYEDLEHSHQSRNEMNQIAYGRYGTPLSFALEQSVAELEGAFGGITTSSGLAAITSSIMSFTGSGDHILVTDSVYKPTRSFCDVVLKGYGVETTYYDPLIGDGISDLIRPETKVIFLESPGSQTLEVQDLPAITSVARENGVVTMLDNTWATPLYLNPFELGVDVSIHAATKYITGHSDAMLGIITTTEEHYFTIRDSVRLFGQCAGPDTIFLGLRGLRTLPTRLRQHHESGMTIARWLALRPEVARVIHPALPEDAGYGIWKRDFSGASGLFTFILNPVPTCAVAALVNNTKLFGIGYSWGGFESLLIPFDPTGYRTATKWETEGPALRMHVGLEDTDDLIADLEAGFEAMAQST
ncbi:MAG: cystathionine beta-lyase [Acidiferrobacterales bacterium]|nr:cystathionine beta-lyase [Acidiferrobacterales bacterium]